jgi:molybdopterin-containing oxidoreductase family iron-sulfur binding subunit
VSDAPQKPSRRDLLRVVGAGAAAATAASCGSSTSSEAFADYFQQHYRKMSAEEIQSTIERLERKYAAKYGVEVDVANTPPIDGVVFGYAINISKCKGYRECVKACVLENNQSREPEIQYIRVMELDKGSMNLETADHYYEHDLVPQPGKFYLPVQCMQCENPPCVKACPVEATWREEDGIVVIDYDWCIGCRYCATACPYWARKFNWAEPAIPAAELNPKTHYLSNRPRAVGVMEKCTFCLQRTRTGKMPACQEACPTGARVFGNLLDPHSEIRYVLEKKTVFRLKEELNTEPKLWYYTD